MQRQTFAGRTAPWQAVPNSVVFNESITTKEMLSRAGLANWNVRSVPLAEIVEYGYDVSPNQYVTVRNSQTVHGQQEILGTVKSRYHPMQNEDAFAWADNILDGGGTWDTAGSFNYGNKVFGSLLIDQDAICVDRGGLNDTVDTYLLVSTSHDGSLPLQSSIVNLRTICQNTFTTNLQMIAKSEVPQTFKIRHTATAEARADVARDALRLTFKYSKDFDILANEMFQRKVSPDDFNKIVKWIYPEPPAEDKAANTRWVNKIELLNELRVSDTNININNTAWGIYNTLTERLDWFRQGGNAETKALAGSGFSLTANAEKERILNVVLAATS